MILADADRIFEILTGKFTMPIIKYPAALQTRRYTTLWTKYLCQKTSYLLFNEIYRIITVRKKCNGSSRCFSHYI